MNCVCFYYTVQITNLHFIYYTNFVIIAKWVDIINMEIIKDLERIVLTTSIYIAKIELFIYDQFLLFRKKLIIVKALCLLNLLSGNVTPIVGVTWNSITEDIFSIAMDILILIAEKIIVIYCASRLDCEIST